MARIIGDFYHSTGGFSNTASNCQVYYVTEIPENVCAYLVSLLARIQVCSAGGILVGCVTNFPRWEEDVLVMLL